jgi:transcriptional regulator with XRE-family HTH domain
MELEEKQMVSIGNRIKVLRKAVGMSQERLAELLGVSRPTVSQIENGDRKVSAEELKKLADIFNTSADSLLNPQKSPTVSVKESKAVYKTAPQIRINVPQKNLEKFREVLLYILNKVGAKPNIGETVIYKLLYFIDFDYYEKYEEQLIGATYMKNRYGPTPIEFAKLIEKILNKDLVRVKDKYFDYPQTKYLPLRKADLSKLSGSEIELIDNVLDRLSDMNAAQISDYVHNDVPWLTTDDGGIIEYESVFYRTSPYSLREYLEDIY